MKIEKDLETDMLVDELKQLKISESVVMTPPTTTLTSKQYSSENSSNSSVIQTATVSQKSISLEGLKKSESGLEMKTLLKLIDNEVSKHPITDDDESEVEKLDNFTKSSLVACAAAGDYSTPPTNPYLLSREKVTISETLFVPVKKYPKYNFVGRILGPRGMTVKQLEKETHCKIYVRGRASNLAFNPHTKILRGGVMSNKSSLSTISQSALTDDPLHVYIECTDYEAAAPKKLANAVNIISDLLSPPADGRDELKRQQLVDISLINGTYRQTQATATAITRHRRSDQQHKSIDPTAKEAPIEKYEGRGQQQQTPVYRIPQQKRTWQKPREFNANTEEFAKSVSSREYVSNFVTKTKEQQQQQSVRGVIGDGGDTNDSMLLPPKTITESLKIVHKLLESHQLMSLAPIPGENLEEQQQQPPALQQYHHHHHQQMPMHPMAPAPIPYMIPFMPPFAQIPSSDAYMFRPGGMGDYYFPPTDTTSQPPPFFYMLPPPPPPPLPNCYNNYMDMHHCNY